MSIAKILRPSLLAGTVALLVAVGAPVAQQTPVTAPISSAGGATSLQETHGDWQVVCVAQSPRPSCGVTQEQVDQQSRQRVLAVELHPTGAEIDGILLLPFGLALGQGVTLRVDGQPAGQPRPFSTCLPGGCVVPVHFDATAANALRAGVALKIGVVLDNQQPTQFSLSLKGFASALERTAALAN